MKKLLLFVIFVAFIASPILNINAADNTNTSTSSPKPTPKPSTTPKPASTPTGQSSDKSKSTTDKNAQPKTTPKKTTTKTKSAAKKTTAKKRTPTKSQQAAQPIKMTPDFDVPILYFDPSDISVKKGEKFNTSVILFNPKAVPFDKIQLFIKYNPEILECQAVDKDSWIFKETFKEPADPKVFANKGIVSLIVDLKQPAAHNELDIMTLQWLAKDNINYSEIQFMTDTEHKTTISGTGVDILGDIGKSDDGTIDAGVLVSDEDTRMIDEDAEAEQDEETAQEDEKPDFIFDNMTLPNEKYENIALMLSCENDSVKVGKEFKVDVYLANPDRISFDQIDLLISFDPEVLQVVDKDEENWIAIGVNVFDGEYHETFPFDFHLENSSDNKNGSIRYSVGIANPELLPKKGKFATIYFISQKPSPRTNIVFKKAQSKKEFGTALKYMGHNLLSISDEDSNGIKKPSGKTKNVSLKITE